MLETTSNTVTYTGNGSATTFALPARVDDADDLVVFLTELTTLNKTTLTSAAYGVTGIGSDSGVTVTYPLAGAPLSESYTITIDRVVPYKQETEINNLQGFFPTVVEAALDRLTMMSQQLATELERNKFDPANEAVVDALEAAAEALTKVVGVNNQIDAAYTFVLTDAGKTIEGDRATTQTFTIPTNATTAFLQNTFIDIEQIGAGQITIAPAGGVTLQSYLGRTKLAGQYARARLRKRNTNTWILTGDIVA